MVQGIGFLRGDGTCSFEWADLVLGNVKRKEASMLYQVEKRPSRDHEDARLGNPAHAETEPRCGHQTRTIGCLLGGCRVGEVIHQLVSYYADVAAIVWRY